MNIKGLLHFLVSTRVITINFGTKISLVSHVFFIHEQFFARVVTCYQSFL